MKWRKHATSGISFDQLVHLVELSFARVVAFSVDRHNGQAHPRWPRFTRVGAERAFKKV